MANDGNEKKSTNEGTNERTNVEYCFAQHKKSLRAAKAAFPNKAKGTGTQTHSHH